MARPRGDPFHYRRSRRQYGRPRRAQGLTQREQAVLKGIFEGLTNKEIGARLAISKAR